MQAEFDVAHSTAMRALKRLVDANILEEFTGKGRNRPFAARKVLDISNVQKLKFLHILIFNQTSPVDPTNDSLNCGS